MGHSEKNAGRSAEKWLCARTLGVEQALDLSAGDKWNGPAVLTKPFACRQFHGPAVSSPRA
jgi:hypothetical protein